MKNVNKKDIILVLFTKTAQWQKDLKDIFKGATPFTSVEASGSVTVKKNFRPGKDYKA